MRAPPGCFWIGSDHPFDLAETYLNFRADLTLDRVPPAARLHLSADSRYRLWINGTFVARGPERSWPQAMAVDGIDIGRHLRPGQNAIAVQVYSPGYSHFAHVHRAACGLIAWLEAGEDVPLVSDTSWRVRRDPSWAAGVPRVSIYGSGVELRDMSLDSDWQAAEASAWARARIVQPAEGPVWAGLRPRTTPAPLETRRTLALPWQTRLGPAGRASADPHADLRAALAGLTPAPVPARLAPGQGAIWIFDLGQSLPCIGSATLTAEGGETLTIGYAEKLRDGEVLLSDPATYCRMRPTDRFALRPGRQRLEGFTTRGGRYLIFMLTSSAGTLPRPVFEAVIPSYPLAEHPLPDLADSRLRSVAALCRRSLLACLQDGFVDSVWRESSQWLGDAVAQAFALQAISDDARPLRLTIDMAAAGAGPDGILPSVLPGEVPAYVVADYNFSWVELLTLYARHPGAPDAAGVIGRHWPVLARMLAAFAEDAGDDGLIRNRPGRRLFLDWSPMDRAEPNLTFNLRYLQALRLAGELAVWAGRPDPWAGPAARLASAIRGRLHGPRGWRESPEGAQASQLALALLILTGLADDPASLADAIVARSLDPSDAALPGQPALASPFMHHYLFQALDSLGRGADILAIIALRWGRWADAGEATTWENWDISFPDGSACHGFSAHPLGWLARCRA